LKAVGPTDSLLRGYAALPWYRLWLVGLSLLIGVAGFSAINGQVVGLYHDDGIYAVVAKSLAEGEGYRVASLPTNPAQTKYPFLYSLLLSFIWNLDPRFPENLFLLKAFNVACLIGIFLLSFVFFVRKVQRIEWDALLFAMLVVFNPALFSFAEFLLSDVFFSMLILLVLALFSEPEEENSSPLKVASFALLIGLIYLTKPAGLPLAIAGVLCFLVRRHYRDLLVYTAVLLMIVSLWFWWVADHSGEIKNALLSYYVGHDHSHVALISVWSNPTGAFEMIWANLNYIKDSLTYILFMRQAPGVSVLVLALLAIGFWRSFQRKLVFWNSFIVLYLFMLLIWPWHPLRYLLPIVPLVIFFFFQGVYQLQDCVAAIQRRSRWKTLSLAVAGVPLVFLVVFDLLWVSSYLGGTRPNVIRFPLGVRVPYAWDGFAETFDWIKQNTDESAILATAYDPTYYLYTGRKAVRPGFHKPESYFYPYGSPRPDVGPSLAVKENLTRLGVGYLIVDPLLGYAEQPAQEKVMLELLQLYPRQPELVFVSQDSLHKIYALP
jgi:hypothetical protein